MNDIGIVDYGAGNIASVEQAFEYAGADIIRVKHPEEILKCQRLVLPGVGAAGEALQHIRNNSIDEALIEMIQVKGVPTFGICLGMQMLADKLYEFGEHDGLGFIPGEVVRIDNVVKNALKIPHMGWNRVNFEIDNKFYNSRKSSRKEFYFAHSYTFRVKEKNHIAAFVDYPEPLVAAVQLKNIFASQFHPEKSQIAGDNLIQAFLDWAP
jgi:imidazole glycerol-phosphate synthase subunit HisH